MPNVFTIFALGTNEESQQENDYRGLIAQFAEACYGGENDENKLVLQGPKGIRGIQTVEQNIEKGIDGILSWLEKADEIEEDEQYIINMAGFSRGGVTCLRIANRLKKYIEDGFPNREPISETLRKKLGQLKINIIANDPTAGLGDKGGPDNTLIRHGKEAKIIPDLVKNCVFTYQLDELRYEFKPQDRSRIRIQDPRQSAVHFLPLYGTHTNANQISDAELVNMPVINWCLTYDFLTGHGTQFKKLTKREVVYGKVVKEFSDDGATTKDRIPELVVMKSPCQYRPLPEALTSEDEIIRNKALLEQYASAQLKGRRETYIRAAEQFEFDHFLPKTQRSLTRRLGDYVTDTFFLNQHQRELFKLCYPQAFNYLFEKHLQENIEIHEDCADEHLHDGSDGSESDSDSNDDFLQIKAVESEDKEKEKETETKIKDSRQRPVPNTIIRENQVKFDLLRMRKDNPNLFHVLQEQGKIDFYSGGRLTINNIILPSQPGGVHRIERCRLIKGRNQADHPFSALEALEAQIMQDVLSYQRDKTVAFTYSNKEHKDRAAQIKQGMYDILNGQGTEADKYQRILDYVENHFKRLVCSGSNSDLIKLLQDTLEQHGRQYEMNTHQNHTSRFGHSVKFLGECATFTGRGLTLSGGVITSPLRLLGGYMKESSHEPVRQIGSVVKAISNFGLFPGKVIELVGKTCKQGAREIILSSNAYQVTSQYKADVVVREGSKSDESGEENSPLMQSHRKN